MSVNVVTQDSFWLTGVKNSQRGTVLIGKYQLTSSGMVAKGIWQKKMDST